MSACTSPTLAKPALSDLMRRFLLVVTAILASLPFTAQDKPKRPRITGIDHVRLYVTDIGKASAFRSDETLSPGRHRDSCLPAIYRAGQTEAPAHHRHRSCPPVRHRHWQSQRFPI